jgi:hypothetical protein
MKRMKKIMKKLERNLRKKRNHSGKQDGENS